MIKEQVIQHYASKKGITISESKKSHEMLEGFLELAVNLSAIKRLTKNSGGVSCL